MSTTYAISEVPAHAQYHGHPYAPVQPGEVIQTWCSVHMDRTPHRYDPAGKAKLVCEDCEREAAK